LQITALKAERGPGIEFLEYIAPPGGPPVAWRMRRRATLSSGTRNSVVDDLRPKPQHFRASGATSVSKLNNNSRAQIVRDPDGHALQLNAAANGHGSKVNSLLKGFSAASDSSPQRNNQP